MPRRGENIHKRKDGRWEGRYIKNYDINGKAKYGSVYSKSYLEVKIKLNEQKYSKYKSLIETHLIPDIGYIDIKRVLLPS